MIEEEEAGVHAGRRFFGHFGVGSRLMLRHRSVALLLMITLLAAMLPAGRGEGCRLCGKLGRCCCFTRPAAHPAHCAMVGGMNNRTACSMERSPARPAALRAPQTLPERTAAFAVPAVPGTPESAGLAAAAVARRPSRFSSLPPTPPPRAVRFV
jgi:hypothetical protein